MQYCAIIEHKFTDLGVLIVANQRNEVPEYSLMIQTDDDVSKVKENIKGRPDEPIALTLDIFEIRPSLLDSLVSILKQNNNLQSVCLEIQNLSDDDFCTIINAVKDNPHITTFRLENTALTSDKDDKKINALTELITENTTITKLELDACDLEDKGITAIASALKGNTTLKSLAIRDDEINVNTATNAFADALRDNTTLTSLDLAATTIKDTATFLETLANNTTLQSINLWAVMRDETQENREKQLNTLTQWCKQNTSLTSLNLGSNFLNGAALNILLDGLSDDTSLTTLNLSCNDFSDLSDENTETLANWLRDNTTLTTLDLSGTNINENNINTIAQGLAKNTTLTTLKLDNNDLNNDSIQSLLGALETNTTIENISCEYNFSCSNAMKRKLYETLSSRKPHMKWGSWSKLILDDAIQATKPAWYITLEATVVNVTPYAAPDEFKDDLKTPLKGIKNIRQGIKDLVTRLATWPVYLHHFRVNDNQDSKAFDAYIRMSKPQKWIYGFTYPLSRIIKGGLLIGRGITQIAVTPFMWFARPLIKGISSLSTLFVARKTGKSYHDEAIANKQTAWRPAESYEVSPEKHIGRNYQYQANQSKPTDKESPRKDTPDENDQGPSHGT